MKLEYHPQEGRIVIVEIDEGPKLDLLVAKLRRRALKSKNGTASAAHGVIRVRFKTERD